jgi:hypothetical protein
MEAIGRATMVTSTITAQIDDMRPGSATIC